ncbi:MAG: bacterioferritin [Nitrospinota bacterium]
MSKEKLIEGLNADLNTELTTVLRYILHHSMAKGLGGEELRELIEPDITEELGHAQYLADKIVALGGTPKLAPRMPALTSDVNEMMQEDLRAEVEAIRNYTERIRQAEEAGEVGLKVKLEEFAADETEHKEDLERLMG